MIEENEIELKVKMKKKEYSAPQVEMIGEVRDVTRGGTGGGSDLGRPGETPYDPH